MERVRYDLFVGINTQTFAVICNSAVWAVSLCVSAHRHRVPFLGIQPSNVPSSGSLEHIFCIYSTGQGLGAEDCACFTKEDEDRM